MQMNYTVLIQARVASTRLPAKVLLPIYGNESILQFIFNKFYRQKLNVLVATSTDANDDIIAEQFGSNVFRGPQDDVLTRFAEAAKFHKSEHVFRITGDCPLIPDGLIDTLIYIYESNTYDYVATATCDPTLSCWPDGFDCEIMRRDVLIDAADRSEEREHPTKYILEHFERYRIFQYESGIQHVDKPKLSVDTLNDYLRVWRVVQHLAKGNRHPAHATAHDIVEAAEACNA